MRQSEDILNIFREKGEITVAEAPEPVEITPYGSRFRLPFGEFSIRLPGRHQMRNASLALYGLRASGLTLKNLEAGLREAEWPGRLEWLGDTLLDGAHNPQGARTLREYLEEHFPGAGMTLITGMMRDKQVEACASILAPLFPCVVATRVSEPRAAEPERVAAAYAAFGCETRTAESVEEALAAVPGPRVVAGSLYLVGAARALLKGESVWNFTTSRCS